MHTITTQENETHANVECNVGESFLKSYQEIVKSETLIERNKALRGHEENVVSMIDNLDDSFLKDSD